MDLHSGLPGKAHWFPEGQPHPLVLGSQSPRRRDLLAQIGLEFIQLAVPVDESWPDALEPRAAVAEIARRKSVAVAREVSDSVILGADTAVMLDDEPLGKPRSNEHALEMLSRLAGRAHQVVTGIALVDQTSGSVILDSAATLVEMRVASKAELRAYAESEEPHDKAGAYGIQGAGAGLVTRIEGCYFNVVGLPISKVIKCLHQIMKDRKTAL